MDVLSDVLAASGFSGAVIGSTILRRPWGVEVDPTRHAAVHFVQRGDCWLRLADGRDPVHLGEGDIILVGTGVGHVLCNPVDAPTMPLAGALTPARHDDGDGTMLLCAKYAFTGLGPHPMVSLFPPLIHLTGGQIAANETLRIAVALLLAEAQGDGVGHDIVAPRLLDGFLVLLLRAWMQSQPMGKGGWFGALRDKGVAQALRRIHEQPGTPWTIAALAEAAGQSRATFARRFTELIGEPPLSYVTRWRMNLAAKALRETSKTVGEIGYAIGYESAPSFSQAFKRLTGQSPGRYRDANPH